METSGSGRLPRQACGKWGFLHHGASVSSLQEEAQCLGGCGAEQGRGWQGGAPSTGLDRSRLCSCCGRRVGWLCGARGHTRVSRTGGWSLWGQDVLWWQSTPGPSLMPAPKQCAMSVASGGQALPLARWCALALGEKKRTGLGLCLPVGERVAAAGAGLLAATDPSGLRWEWRFSVERSR